MRSARQRRQEKKRRQIYWMCRMSDSLVPVDWAWVQSLSDAKLHKTHKLVSFVYKVCGIHADTIVAGTITFEEAA